MPKSTLALKATVTKRQAAEPVPSDMGERLRQMQHHEAQTVGASTGTEPAQDPEQARQTAVEAATATPEEPSGKALKQGPHAVQSAFLSGNLGKPITVFTLNNVRLTGKLRQFDQFMLLLEGPDGLNSLIFKHAITTVVPAGDATG